MSWRADEISTAGNFAAKLKDFSVNSVTIRFVRVLKISIFTF